MSVATVLLWAVAMWTAVRIVRYLPAGRRAAAAARAGHKPNADDRHGACYAEIEDEYRRALAERRRLRGREAGKRVRRHATITESASDDSPSRTDREPAHERNDRS